MHGWGGKKSNMTVYDVYRILDDAAPFAAQESYDNSGLLVGAPNQEVHHVLLTLDITVPVVNEAVECGADLILAHHPVIWQPLKSISPIHPVWHLVQHNIAAICSHTCMDVAANGLNTQIGHQMKQELPLTGAWQPLETLSGGRVLGFCADLQAPWTAAQMAAALSHIYDARTLRYYDANRPIHRIAWCSGSGGDLIETAIARGADALITGDCKHSIWMEAQNRQFTLFDCGHFETEVPVTEIFWQLLAPYAKQIQVSISAAGTQPPYQVTVS